MKRANRRQTAKSASELIEEAIHLLRSAPVATLASYYLGALPFVLGLLYFWADMSRSPSANQHLIAGSLALGALFLWMKFRQALFARELRALLSGEPAPRIGFRRGLRIFITQTALQPTAFFLLPLAVLPVLPFPWAYAFYQNLTALADGEPATLRDQMRKAQQQAALWPKQNLLLLLILFGFGFYVFLNWSTVFFLLPGLAKMLFGLESTFTRSGLSMLNTTFFAV